MVLMQYSREHPDAQMAAQILALEETAWAFGWRKCSLSPLLLKRMSLLFVLHR